ncbi:MAG: inositol monophosphatase family protein [Longimicrobiales bacterium]
MRQGTVNLKELLAVSQDWAQAAGATALRHFGGVLESEVKGDGTPVTVADRATEAFLRARIGRRYPIHGILGEEHGEENPGAHVRWILDPIDGTKSFVRGVPLFGVLIGIEVGGEPAVGVAHFPGLGETVAAAVGEGCYWNGGPARVSAISSIEASAVLTTDPKELLDGSLTSGLQEITRRSALARSWGDCYGHILVATGRAEIMVDPILSPWDAAPFVPILSEAGGRFTDKDGVAGAHGGSGVSTNGILHEEVLRILRGQSLEGR